MVRVGRWDQEREAIRGNQNRCIQRGSGQKGKNYSQKPSKKFKEGEFDCCNNVKENENRKNDTRFCDKEVMGYL